MAQNKSLSTQEVADILHVSKSTIYDLIRRGEIHSYKIGRKVRFTQDDVDAYIARSRHEHSTRPVKKVDTHSTLLTPPEQDEPDLIISGQDVILDIEVQGAMQVAEKMPEVVRIFIAPPSWSELERRLTARGTDTPEKIQGRLARAKEEVKLADTYDYFVINDSVENAVRELDAIMTAEHCKPQDRMEVLEQE